MKRTLFLTALTAWLFNPVMADVTYTVLSTAFKDTEHNVSYDGNGSFRVGSDVGTSVSLTLDLDKLYDYINATNYPQNGGYMFKWSTTVDIGLYEQRTSTTNESGETCSTPVLVGAHSTNSIYQKDNTITYDKLESLDTDKDRKVTLTFSISSSSTVKKEGVKVSHEGADIYQAAGLGASSNTAITGYYINTQYITDITLHAESTLTPGQYYAQAPFVSSRTDKTSIGRVTFIGDSITHGVNDMTYRWQFFKILTDNGIENEIVGPLSGNKDTPNTRDYITSDGTSYGGVLFDNVHYAEASGRSRNVLAGGQCNDPAPCMNSNTGVAYSGWSAEETGTFYNSDTWFCMLGTNDILSDTTNGVSKNGITPENYCGRMQVLLGGNFSFTETGEQGSKIGEYTWTQTDNWGNMGSIVENVCEEGDTFYMLSIIPGGPSTDNHDLASDRLAVQKYNENLKLWCAAYSEAHNKNVVYVDVTHGMVDKTGGQIDGKSGLPFYAPNQFFNTVKTGDDIHPCEQGSLLMAGNLARAMNLGGRTAGLQRQSSIGWDSATIGTVADGTSVQAAADAFSLDGGYTVDFSASFGDGAQNGWLGTDCSLSISVGDGCYGGTLRLTEGYIMWGDSTLLFCWDTSQLAGWDDATTDLSTDGNLRIAWHNGNTSENIMKGYYVWLDDMLIGQGLDASQNITLNGIEISANGADGVVTGLSWTNTAYAPTTLGTTSTEHALLTTQDLPPMPVGERNNTPTSSGVDYSGINATTLTNDFISSTTKGSGTHTFVLGTQNGFNDANVAILESRSGTAKHTGKIITKITGNLKANLVGVQNGAQANELLVEVSEAPAYVHNRSADNGAIIAVCNGGSVNTFNLYVNGGGVGGDIVGGESKSDGTGTVGQTNIYINNGNINGNILGGGKSANGSVGNASIRVNGGTINGSIIAGGTAGSIGNTDVTITGGIIKGGIEMGAATRTNNGTANVTIIGNKASIGGNITADNVILRNVTESAYSDGFDKYAGTISATSLTLDNVQVALKAGLSESISTIEVENQSNTSAVMGDTFSLSKLLLSNGTTFSAYKEDSAANSATSEYESTLVITTLQVGIGATLNANLVFNSDSVLILNDSLTMGSDVALSSGMTLTLSDTMLNNLYGMNEVALFAGVDKLTLDGQELADGTTISANSIFSNLDPERNVNLSFSSGTVSIYAIPEPATATLSLLALAGLAMRRRRRG